MNIAEVTRSIITSIQMTENGLQEPYVILMRGKHGIGKSDIVQFIFESFISKMQGIVDLRLGNISDIGELAGLPHKDEKTRKTVYFKPEWFPDEHPEIQAIVDQGLKREDELRLCAEKFKEIRARGEKVGGIIFLDEINRGAVDIQKGVFQMVRDRMILTHRIPFGWTMVAAINPASDSNYDVNEMEAALLSRFVPVDFELTDSDWLEYARDKIWSPLYQVLNKNRNLIGVRTQSSEGRGIDEVTPCPRSWFRVNSFLKHVTDNFKNVSPELLQSPFVRGNVTGNVGMTATNIVIQAMVKTSLMPIGGEDVLFNIDKYEKRVISWTKPDDQGVMNPDILCATSRNVATYIHDNRMADDVFASAVHNFCKYLTLIPNSLAEIRAEAINDVQNYIQKSTSKHTFNEFMSRMNVEEDAIRAKTGKALLESLQEFEK